MFISLLLVEHNQMVYCERAFKHLFITSTTFTILHLLLGMKVSICSPHVGTTRTPLYHTEKGVDGHCRGGVFGR